ncbi:MAG: amidohydrolase family protein [Victivallaceae bacterium]|jgi:N-acetylglucosamine-6-phosphate deacetylase
MRYIKGRIVTPDSIVNGAVVVKHGRIAGVESDTSSYRDVFDYGLNLIVPGFIDIHLHGIGPYIMFGVDDMTGAAKLQLQYGTTAFLPTAASMTDDEFMEFARNIAQAQKCAGGAGAVIIGAHFEGPFINPAKKGGMDAKYLQPMSMEKCRRYAETGVLKYMTLSPELPGSEEVIRYLSRNGIAVSLGHTTATCKESLAATDAGAASVCHLFNTFDRTGEAEPGVWKPGLVEAILENKKLFCELICDMQHVFPAYIRLAEATLRPHRFIAITDSMTGAGQQPGDYRMVDGRWYSTASGAGRLRDEPGRNGLVGSIITMNQAFANLINVCGFDAVAAVRYTSTNAALLLGLDREMGAIESGRRANLAVLNERYECVATFIDGERLYAN